MIYEKEVKVLIAAAGKGSRANLPYPKTLYKVDGEEILLRILNTTKNLDQNATIIVSPQGELDIRNFLINSSKKAEIIIQEEARGMGDAFLKFEKSSYFSISENILLIWGDIPYIKSKTISKMIDCHIKSNNILTFVTADSDKAYTRVIRDEHNKVIDLIETREENLLVEKGERDIGLFIFKKNEIFNLLKQDLPKKHSLKTKEHGFLYLINHCFKRGLKVEALKIADQKELISLNRISDLKETK